MSLTLDSTNIDYLGKINLLSINLRINNSTSVQYNIMNKLRQLFQLSPTLTSSNNNHSAYTKMQINSMLRLIVMAMMLVMSNAYLITNKLQSLQPSSIHYMGSIYPYTIHMIRYNESQPIQDTINSTSQNNDEHNYTQTTRNTRNTRNTHYVMQTTHYVLQKIKFNNNEVSNQQYGHQQFNPITNTTGSHQYIDHDRLADENSSSSNTYQSRLLGLLPNHIVFAPQHDAEYVHMTIFQHKFLLVENYTQHMQSEPASHNSSSSSNTSSSDTNNTSWYKTTIHLYRIDINNFIYRVQQQQQPSSGTSDTGFIDQIYNSVAAQLQQLHQVRQQINKLQQLLENGLKQTELAESMAIGYENIVVQETSLQRKYTMPNKYRWDIAYNGSNFRIAAIDQNISLNQPLLLRINDRGFSEDFHRDWYNLQLYHSSIDYDIRYIKILPSVNSIIQDQQAFYIVIGNQWQFSVLQVHLNQYHLLYKWGSQPKEEPDNTNTVKQGVISMMDKYEDELGHHQLGFIYNHDRVVMMQIINNTLHRKCTSHPLSTYQLHTDIQTQQTNIQTQQTNIQQSKLIYTQKICYKYLMTCLSTSLSNHSVDTIHNIQNVQCSIFNTDCEALQAIIKLPSKYINMQVDVHFSSSQLIKEHRSIQISQQQYLKYINVQPDKADADAVYIDEQSCSQKITLVFKVDGVKDETNIFPMKSCTHKYVAYYKSTITGNQSITRNQSYSNDSMSMITNSSAQLYGQQTVSDQYIIQSTQKYDYSVLAKLEQQNWFPIHALVDAKQYRFCYLDRLLMSRLKNKLLWQFQHSIFDKQPTFQPWKHYYAPLINMTRKKSLAVDTADSTISADRDSLKYSECRVQFYADSGLDPNSSATDQKVYAQIIFNPSWKLCKIYIETLKSNILFRLSEKSIRSISSTATVYNFSVYRCSSSFNTNNPKCHYDDHEGTTGEINYYLKTNSPNLIYIVNNNIQDHNFQLTLIDINTQQIKNVLRVTYITFFIFFVICLGSLFFIICRKLVMFLLAYWNLIEPNNIRFTYPLGYWELRIKMKQYIHINIIVVKICEKSRMDDDCCFCLQAIGEQKRLIEAYCHHYFHQSCFEQWVRQEQGQLACPMCKRKLSSAGLNEYLEQGIKKNSYKLGNIEQNEVAAVAQINDDIFQQDF